MAAQDHQARMDEAAYLKTKRDQELALQNELRTEAQNTPTQGAVIENSNGSKFVQPDVDTAERALQTQADEAPMEPPKPLADVADGQSLEQTAASAQLAAKPTVRAATWVKSPTGENKYFAPTPAGLSDATAYAQSTYDPVSNNRRLANIYRKYDPIKAMEYESKAQEFEQKQYDYGRQRIYQDGAELIASGKFGALADMYNKHYNDGRTAEFVPNGSGGGSFVQKDSNGVILGTMDFKDADDVMIKWRDFIFPDKRAEYIAASRQDAAKPFDLKPGEQRFVSGLDGKPRVVASNTNMTSADASALRAGMGNSGSTRGTGKPEMLPPEEVTKHVLDVAKESGGKSLNETQVSQASAVAVQALKSNPGLDVRAAAYAGFLSLDPKNVLPRFNNSTWTSGKAVVSPLGMAVFVGGSPVSQDEAAQSAKDGVPVAFAGLQQRDPQTAELMLRAAAGDTKAGNELHANTDKAIRDRAVRQNPTATPEQIEEVVKKAVDAADAETTRRINMLNKYAPELYAKYVPGGKKPSVDAPTGGTSALPADLQSRLQAQAAGLAAAKAKAVQELARKAELVSKAKSEVGGLTVEGARVLTPLEAKKIRNDPQQWGILPVDVKRILTDKAGQASSPFLTTRSYN